MDFKKSFYKPVKPFYPFTYWEKNNTGARAISKRYQRGLNYDPSCKLYLPFYKHGKNETTIYDQSGHGNHATIAGAVANSPSMNSGGDLVNNGACTTDVGWTYGADWAWNAGGWYTKAGAGATVLEQDISATGNKMFTLTYTMTRTAGTLTPSIGGVNGTARVLSGTYTENIYATGTANLKFTPDAAFAGTVDVVSVRNTGGLGGYCDGTDDRFTLSNVFTTDQTGLTILSWIYCHSFDQPVGVAIRNALYSARNVAVNEGYILSTDYLATNVSTWYFRVYDGAASSAVALAYLSDANFNTAYQNKWLCICCSFEASTRMKLWINGSAAVADKTAGVVAKMDPETTASDYIAYGAVFPAYANFTYGELGLLNRAFSDTELSNFFQITRRRYGI